MSIEGAKIEVKDGGAWPPKISERLVYLMELALREDFSLMCAVGLDHKTKQLSVFFSPTTSQNPHLAEACSDIAQLFTLMAKRYTQ